MLFVTIIPLYTLLGYTADFIILISYNCLFSQELSYILFKL
jgi:hypothetical protein